MLMGRLLLKRNTKILASIPRKVKMSIHYVIINTSIFFLLKLAILVKLKVSECFSFFFKALYLTLKSHFCRQNLSLLVERYITTVENENRTLDHLAKSSTLDTRPRKVVGFQRNLISVAAGNRNTQSCCTSRGRSQNELSRIEIKSK